MLTEERSFNSLLTEVRDAGQDHEWYPTTDEIIAALVKDIPKCRSAHESGTSLLDIGAGDGRVLKAVKAAFQGSDRTITDLFAIEKSAILREALDRDIFVVGTTFEEQMLFTKSAAIIYSNPPYSVFTDWAVKIIRESPAPLVYLVIPTRWKDSVEIADALKFREARAHVVGTFTFEEGDRQARAVVNLLRIELDPGKSCAFNRFFDEQFGGMRAEHAAKRATEAKADEGRRAAGKTKFDSLVVVGESYPAALVSLYMQDLAHIQRQYAGIATLDAALLMEFEIYTETILKWLRSKLEGLRNTYWKELFSRMSVITDRLTSKNRARLLEKLMSHAHVDFTVDNIQAIIIWTLKNANQFLDTQVVDVFEQMVEKANVHNYKSNERVFTWDKWCYNKPEGMSHYALDYRIVLARLGGIKVCQFMKRAEGLEERACLFLGDLLTVARNLGFQCQTADPRVIYSFRNDWEAGKSETFYFAKNYEVGDRVNLGDAANQRRHPITEIVKMENGSGYQYCVDGEWYHQKCFPGEELFEVKAFKNGNTHIRLNQRFALALNVEYGRLKGWLKTANEAVEELGEVEAADFFKSNLQLGAGDSPFLLLGCA